MKENSFLHVLKVYIKQYLRIVTLFFVVVVIFAIVFYLYALPLEPIAYATLLSVILVGLFFVYDFFKFTECHHILQDLKNRITLGIDGLPKTKGLIEEDYQKLLIELNSNKTRLVLDADISRTEMIEYYTLWAHQIKTPISAMRLLLQTEQLKEYEDLSIELIKIEQYVEMVLQYLRLDTMSSDIQLEWLELSDLIRQALRKSSKTFILKKITLDYKEPTSQVLTDKKWIVFVIEQILSNALKYTQQGAISIYMDTYAEKTLIIEDTGIGIKEEDLPRIFQKGFTGYNGRRDMKSTGIGLYLCKRILTKLSHTITITSTVGVGTRVYIDFSMVDTIME